MKTIKDFFSEFENAEIVRRFFGDFIDFHDSEIIEIRLNRELGFDFTGPKLFLTLFTFNAWVSHDDPKRKNSKVELLFEKVELDYIKMFNHQNAMADFNMEKYYCDRLKQDRYRIKFGEFGAKVKFTCETINVLSINEFQPNDYFKKE